MERRGAGSVRLETAGLGGEDEEGSAGEGGAGGEGGEGRIRMDGV